MLTCFLHHGQVTALKGSAGNADNSNRGRLHGSQEGHVRSLVLDRSCSPAPAPFSHRVPCEPIDMHFSRRFRFDLHVFACLVLDVRSLKILVSCHLHLVQGKLSVAAKKRHWRRGDEQLQVA